MLVIALFVVIAAAVGHAAILAPLRTPSNPDRIIPGRYIVRLKTPDNQPNESVLAVAAMHVSWLEDQIGRDQFSENRLHHVYDVRPGYAGDFSEAMLQEIRRRPEVAYVEPDQVMHVVDEQFLADLPETIMDWRDYLGLNGVGRPKARFQASGKRIVRSKRLTNKIAPSTQSKTTREQSNAPWGLRRLSNRQLFNKTTGEEESKYIYPETAGEGVDVYVIDTGINVRHKDFEGRAHWGKTIPMFDEDIDGNGHGTHCAGTIGGKIYGVAKRVQLFAVKVLMTSGFGTNSDVIKGVEWVIKRHYRNCRSKRRSVANMSLGGGKSQLLEEVINLATELGVHFAVAAGNDNEDACAYSPAGAKGPVTVGAVDIKDNMAFFSNYGRCVDLFAPGVDITSAWIGSRYAKRTISGTSMASPHVAGVLALYLGEKDYTPSQLKRVLVRHSRKNVISAIPDGSMTVNRLVCIDHLL